MRIRQAQNTFDNLKAAWEVRKTELEARLRAMGGAGLFGGGAMYGGPAQQYAQLENMPKEAGLHVGKRRVHFTRVFRAEH